jgi:glycosyltransferase involved in cell wall biosynthesis
VIGFVGRLVEEKGGTMLLDTLAKLDGMWQLDVIGDGPEKTNLIEQSKRLRIADRVSFATLPSTRMPGYYQGIDVLVVPSLTRPNWKEQFGRVIIEAMACGVPVIGSDSGAIPDVIGQDGLIFPEGDSEALLSHLRTVQRSRSMRQELGQRGRDRVKKNYTQAQVAAQTVDIYRSLCSR